MRRRDQKKMDALRKVEGVAFVFKQIFFLQCMLLKFEKKF